jgi:hypothetical protein
MIGAGAFGLASVAAAFSPSAEALIAARALLGIAGATLMPSTMSLLRTMFPEPKQFSVAIGVYLVPYLTEAWRQQKTPKDALTEANRMANAWLEARPKDR